MGRPIRFWSSLQTRKRSSTAAFVLPLHRHEISGVHASLLPMVERFFAEMTTVVRDQSYTSVSELKSAILRRLAEHNADPKPFRWVPRAK